VQAAPAGRLLDLIVSPAIDARLHGAAFKAVKRVSVAIPRVRLIRVSLICRISLARVAWPPDFDPTACMPSRVASPPSKPQDDDWTSTVRAPNLVVYLS